jgi:hypothetical protein
MSFQRNTEPQNHFVCGTNGNLQPTGPYLDMGFIKYEFRCFSSPLKYFLWLVALNPFPNGYMIAFYKAEQLL